MWKKYFVRKKSLSSIIQFTFFLKYCPIEQSKMHHFLMNIYYIMYFVLTIILIIQTTSDQELLGLQVFFPRTNWKINKKLSFSNVNQTRLLAREARSFFFFKRRAQSPHIVAKFHQGDAFPRHCVLDSMNWPKMLLSAWKSYLPWKGIYYFYNNFKRI